MDPSTTTANQSSVSDQYLFRGTASKKGRHLFVSPENSSMKQLHYGRIILDAKVPQVTFQTGSHEAALMVMSGACVVRVNDEKIALATHDALYVPRGSSVEVSTSGSVDIMECSAEVEGNYPLQVVRYADVQKDDKLRFPTGNDTSRRTINIQIGNNVKAGRLLAGFTCSQPGNWTSWPPHEHSQMLEELYVFFDMPPPAYGVQFVYTNRDTPEFVGMVSDGDAVVVPKGFHPNVACPGHSINFVWMMAAQREGADRQFGVVNVEPAFGAVNSGLEASRK
jgi:5-deoxy-glucuronate isomerase